MKKCDKHNWKCDSFSDRMLAKFARYGHWSFFALLVLEIKEFSFSNFFSGNTFMILLWIVLFISFEYDSRKSSK